MTKSVQIAHNEGKDLTAHRSIHQMTTGATPLYLMSSREMQSKLPELRKEAPVTDEDIRDRNLSGKLSQKEYVDVQRYAVASEVEIGNKVLLRNSKTTNCLQTMTQLFAKSWTGKEEKIKDNKKGHSGIRLIMICESLLIFGALKFAVNSIFYGVKSFVVR